MTVQEIKAAHSRLFHYTTGAGLCGIINSQQLRATHARYLNDAEEQIGFLDRRLPHLLREAAQAAALKRFGNEVNGIDEWVAGMHKALKDSSVKHFHPYVVSFCSATSEQV